MPTDQTLPIRTAEGPRWELPEIVDVSIQAAAYRPRAPKNFVSPMEAAQDAVEIVLTLKSPMPARALAPVLYIGDARLTESEPVDKENKRVRFWAFDPSKLKTGAPIAMAWTGETPPKEQEKAKFRYSLAK
jgi:hypothetical protein